MRPSRPKVRRNIAAAALLSALWLAGCEPPEAPPEIDLLPAMATGGEFVAAGHVAELARVGPGGEPVDWLGTSYWRPLAVVPVDGWGLANEIGWRPQGERSTLRYLRQPGAPADAELFVEFQRRVFDPSELQPELPRLSADAEQRVEIFWDGQALGELEIQVGRSQGRFPLPTPLGEGADVTFVFEPPLTQVEVEAQSVALERCGLVATGARPGTGPAAVLARSQVDRDNQRLQVSGSGTWVTPLVLPPGAELLRFDVRLHGDGEMRLLATTDDGERHALVEVEGGGRFWRQVETQVASLAGRRIVLAAEFATARPAEIRSPRLVLAEAPADGTAPAAGAGEVAAPPRSEQRAAELPDIVVILLDAARGDRVANPGYPRQTTPNIDRMAEDALVFRRAYSECPSTRCSIPNLITGLPFLEAGMGRGGDLDDRAVTLAESLQAAGYRTVSFSANPNNSPGRNAHQGFDEFYKLWGRKTEDHGPFGMSRRAVEVIENHQGPQPLFLQLHYLPPHEPYRPAPEFDVYRDPAYDGTIQPGAPPGPYRRGRQALSDADVQRFVDLYDGNCLMVDDAVSQVFEALQRTGRWDDTLLLVTADHGEAFWEHGEQGHNSTLYEEMIHVPFVLRLPAGQRAAAKDAADTEQLVFLGDVVPTVLGRLGVQPAPDVAGIDLLAEADGQRPPLFFRTANRTSPAFGVRTQRHKLIVRPTTQEQYLFDLRADPGETRNLIAERPHLYTGLALLLRRHLETAAALDFRAEDAPLSAEDEEVLRSLGYV